MPKTHSHPRTPKLRFPEFVWEWEEKKVSEIISKKLTNGVFNDPWKVGRWFKLINVKDMYSWDCIIEKNLSLVDIEESEFLRNRVVYWDIFFTRSSLVKEWIAHSNVYLWNGEDVTFDWHVIKMSYDVNKYNPIFLLKLTKTSSVRKQLIKKGKTTTMTTIWQEEIASTFFSLPSLLEQQKIASFLSSVDEKIESLRNKKELLEKYKKWVMQQIFSQKIRFKDKVNFFGEKRERTLGYEKWKDFPKWEESMLGEICKINKWTQLNWSELTKVWKYLAINWWISESWFTDLWNREPNTITISEWWNSCWYISFIKTKFWCWWHCYSIDKIQNFISNTFLFHILKFNQTRIMRLRVGSWLPNIQKKDIDKFKISFPSLPEQQKIADFLSGIDEKIEKVGQELEQAEKWKKGLLQGMFV